MAPRAIVVTAYVPIPGHPRSEKEYRALCKQLYDLPIPVMVCDAFIEECWLYRYLCWRKGSKVTHSTADNPQKNSLAYHIVQAQKSEWLHRAAEDNVEPDVLVWIDCGIFHLPGITGRIIVDFVRRAAFEKVIAIPGCWDCNYTYDDSQPCWRFCGGVLVVPRPLIMPFDFAMKSEYMRWISLHNHISWEVNTLSRLERAEPRLPIWHYKADHNGEMFTNYQPTGVNSH